MAAPRYSADALVAFGKSLLLARGVDDSIANDVATVLVEGDLLGHDTHGLNLLPGYLKALAGGSMTPTGEPTVLAERSSVCTWDGQRLPGPHLVQRAINWATPRAREHGVATVAIRRSHHIACLAAYLEAPARNGLIIQVLSSDPDVASVAPFGGTRGVFTPNPLAWGIPTGGDPVMVDISASITTNGMSARLTAEGKRGEHAWWLDANGNATTDPTVFTQDPPGTILPLGGLDAGHKGYGLALQVEAFTSALGGHGRADPPEGQGASVFLQLMDPDAFGGLDAFQRQMDWIADACHQNPPRAADRPVRMPGERGLQRKREQQASGVELQAAIMPALTPLASELNVALPTPL
jgi:L-lactate dehydrogenase